MQVSEKPQDILAELFRSNEGCDKNQPGYQHTEGWNAALRHAMDILRVRLAAAEPGPVAEPFAWHIEAKGWGDELRFTKEDADELADRLRTIVGIKEPKITPLFTHPAPVPAGAGAVEAMTDETFEAAARALVPFAYGAFEQHGTVMKPFEPGKPNANAYNATRAVIAALRTAQPAGEGEDELLDKIDGLQADLENAVATAFHRGATEWTRLNYPDQYAKLSALSPSDKEPRS